MVKEGALLWEPTPDITKNAKVTAYMEWLGRPVDYQALWQWSVEAPEEFWASVWDYFGVVGERGDGPVISGTMPGAEWFTGSALNYAENALRRAEAEPDRLAVVSRDESGGRRTLTLGELAAEVAGSAPGSRPWGSAGATGSPPTPPTCPRRSSPSSPPPPWGRSGPPAPRTSARPA